MKKVLLVLGVAMFCSAASLIAQPRAIGARLGYNLEFSYQHSMMGDDNYLQLDAGLLGYGHGFQAVGTYNWVLARPDWSDGYGQFEWFAGFGGGLGLYNYGYYYYDNVYRNSKTSLFAGVAGNIGLAFNFPFDLQLAVDYRPLIGFYFAGGGLRYGYYDSALSIRYLF